MNFAAKILKSYKFLLILTNKFVNSAYSSRFFCNFAMKLIKLKKRV